MVAEQQPIYDPVLEYVYAVLDGDILAGPYVRAACQRHLDDLNRPDPSPIWFDLKAALHAIDFFERFLLLENGEPFLLQSWQKFVIGSIYGWKRTDGSRRFRTAYLEVGKGNGKTPMSAGMGLYGLAVESLKNPGAEIYPAATTKEQAGICFRDAKIMAERSPAIRSALKISTYYLENSRTQSVMRALSSESRSLDGKRVQMGLVDELHEHPTGAVLQKIRAGTKGRTNALIVMITNSGFDLTSVCGHWHTYSARIVEKAVQNDSHFAYVCAMDPKDNWRDPALWIKANPNLGVSIPMSYLEEQVREAHGIPSNESIVKRLNFCIWASAAEKWMPVDLWDACAGPIPWQEMPAAMEGKRCVAGLDLSATTDISCIAYLFRDDDEEEESYDLLCKFWVPYAEAERRLLRDDGRYMEWAQIGALKLTEGNVIDYDEVLEEFERDIEKYDIEEVGFDPWNATQTVVKMEQLGVVTVQIRQGWATLNEPTKKLEELVLRGKLRHGGHPVLRWMLENTMIVSDPAGNKKPDKGKSVDKIDGISATVTAMSRAIFIEPDGIAGDDEETEDGEEAEDILFI